MANVQGKDYISLYKFSQEKGARYQYFNQMMSNGKIPKNILAKDGQGKLFIHKEKGDLWWEGILQAREDRAKVAEERKHNKKEMMVENPEQLLAMLVGWFEQAGRTDLSDPLKEVMEALKANKE